MATVAQPMTAEQLLALPDDGIDRELIRGELRERPKILRTWVRGSIEARVVFEIGCWLDSRPEPRGCVASGQGGFRLHRDPDTAVGVDVAYASPEQVLASSASPLFEGPPVLAVEILSPSDQQEEIDEKVTLYLESGVALVWVIQPRFGTVTIYSQDAGPRMVNDTEVLTAEPHLPGFRVPVARLFA